MGIDIGGSSVKAAATVDGRSWSVANSTRYQRPDTAALRAAIGAACTEVDLSAASGVRIGLCVPGVFDPERGCVVRSLNIPALEGLPLAGFVLDAISDGLPAIRESIEAGAVRVCSDAHAAAFDWVTTHPTAGRLLAISMGTGVGACVLDDGSPLHVSGTTPGHFGQIDVSIGEPGDAPLGTDGGRGGLEAYVGARAMLLRLGEDPSTWERRLGDDPVPLLALGRAIRIAHAIYRPQCGALLGGVGLALGPVRGVLDAMIRDDLTSLARADWTLEVGDDEFHAARGAARLAEPSD